MFQLTVSLLSPGLLIANCFYYCHTVLRLSTV